MSCRQGRRIGNFRTMKTAEKELIVIDGSQGEGGGQIFRTSLSLAACLGKPVQIEHIRSGRKKSGLLRQHLTCLRAVQAICDATVLGDELGSEKVTFIPGAIKPGEYHFAIGTAGSTTLVLQTVLFPLLLAGGSCEVLLEGGTHNGMAPSYDFVAESFLPMLAKMGVRIETQLQRYGFYPAGGGAWRVKIYPATDIAELILLECGEQTSQRAVAISSRIPEHVTSRELARVQSLCGWPQACLNQRLVKSAGPGNILSLQVGMKNVTHVCDSLGERGVSAERVVDRAVEALNHFLSAKVPVGEYLADQLILPMVLGRGGRFRTVKPSTHLLTNIDVVRSMTGADIQLKEIRENCWEVLVVV
jgi:RNA 3'-terminal phosphate cyclase (ATP)